MKKGKMQKGIQINLSYRMFCTIVAIFIIILAGIFVSSYANPSTGVGHAAEEIGDGVIANTIMVNRSTGRVGIGTDDPQVRLDVVGKIRSTPTTDTDSDDTLITKSYVGFVFRYINCGWQPLGTIECPAGELMAGYGPDQIMCCGTGVYSCTATNWQTYQTTCSASCNPSWECGTATGNNIIYQSRTLSDCQVEYRTLTGSSCSESCGGCPTGGYYCDPSHTCQQSGH